MEGSTLPLTVNHHMTVCANHSQIIQNDFPASVRSLTQRHFMMNLGVAYTKFSIASSEVKSAIRYFAYQAAVIFMQRFLNFQVSKSRFAFSMQNEAFFYLALKSLESLFLTLSIVYR